MADLMVCVDWLSTTSDSDVERQKYTVAFSNFKAMANKYYYCQAESLGWQ